MKGCGAKATAIGIAANFLLFLVKLYIGISSNSLAIYCDAVNNLGDTLVCITAFSGFLLIKKLDEKRSLRAQSLCTFLISLVIAVSGIYFIYNGTERMLYPLPVTYTQKYALAIIGTVGAKILMGIMYIFFNKKESSPVLKALILDSFLDCFVTVFALMSLVLIEKVNYAVDGIFAIVTGIIITISAIKNTAQQTKFLINN